ncbi:MAG: Zinc-dependent sulfurtransferase SufU [Mycoplasmataceae bacterium]|nr:MAG: Zinc-dependent sulfurtransferase SufU [Mycoplasmataceae bacterium]
MNKIYSSEEKRKILLNNYNNPDKQIEFEELKKISTNQKIPFLTVRSLDDGCGDTLHLLLVKEKNCLKKCFFSGYQSCLITVASANIILSCLEKKNSRLAKEILDNCQKMIKKEDYDLGECSNFQIFSDIDKFPHRIECIKLVIRGINNLL